MSRLKSMIRRAAHHVGLDVRRYHHGMEMSAGDRAADLICQRDIDLVIDVGANKGQYAQWIRERGYLGRIISFEPLSDAFALLDESTKRDPDWCAINVAIGESDRELELNIAKNSVSSSILPMDARHRSAAPHSVYVGKERVHQRTLDSCLAMDASISPFLKIDVQGNEGAVLDGAIELMPRIVGVQIEMSFVELYSGQPLFDELLHRLEGCGMELWSLIPGFADPGTGRLLQADGIFFRA
ncbi:FkbM family methyltransferase [Agromyces sp. MMS24-JH15]|uniref:FkbM family methyltransferase n=1 Tax=Agromyces sp. MMS24-JH15 TaxID=3243765 RepID=UPI0037498847